MTDPIRPTDDAARELAAGLLDGARFGALGTLRPESGGPMVTRVAVARIGDGPVLLVSDLSDHARALAANPACSLLVGEPGPKGDPLTHPRLTLFATAHDVPKTPLRAAWLERHPKARLYVDFADFRFLRLKVEEAHLNGGFGKAFRLTPDDLLAGRSGS